MPHEQHIDLWDAAHISSSYLLMEDRICVEEMSGGNFCEAISRSLNSSSNKFIASFTHSDVAETSYVFRFLIVRFMGMLGIFEGIFEVGFEGRFEG